MDLFEKPAAPVRHCRDLAREVLILQQERATREVTERQRRPGLRRRVGLICSSPGVQVTLGPLHALDDLRALLAA